MKKNYQIITFFNDDFENATVEKDFLSWNEAQKSLKDFYYYNFDRNIHESAAIRKIGDFYPVWTKIISHSIYKGIQ